MKLAAGDKAPEFALPDQEGKVHRLSDYKGKTVLLYFYPKDDTPGCTAEACRIRDAWADFKKADIEVLGVSPDKVKSHARFARKHKLPFTLLADENKETVEAYGVWAKKKFLGHEYMGTLRNSFLIGPDGKIAKVYEKVRPNEHAGEVLQDVERLKDEKTKS